MAEFIIHIVLCMHCVRDVYLKKGQRKRQSDNVRILAYFRVPALT